MPHFYNVGVAGTNLDTGLGIREAHFVKYTTAQKKGSNLVIPYRHGELHVPDKYFAGADVLLQVYLPFDLESDAIEALSELARLFSAQDEVVVTQDDPHRGAIRSRVELLQDPVPTEDRFTYLFSLRNASGFWEDQAETNVASGTPPAVTTGGDRPIQDMILTFSGPGFLQHTDDLGQVARITIDAGAGAGTYIFDVGAGSCTKGGADQSEFVTVSQPWIMKWQPNDTPSLTADVGVAAAFRNKWA